jgi:hypothetical protein
MGWFSKAETCIRCNTKDAKRDFEGHPTCADCEMKILMDRESARTCPVDGTAMTKEQHAEIIIDRCPNCHGVWLDAGELDTVRQAMSFEGDDFAIGLAIGIAAG